MKYLIIKLINGLNVIPTVDQLYQDGLDWITRRYLCHLLWNLYAPGEQQTLEC